MLMLLFSLSGGLFCYAVCAWLYPRIPLKKLWLLSMIGRCLHNIGQILAAILVLGTADVLWYLPALLASGLISGLLYRTGRRRRAHTAAARVKKCS